MERVRRGGPGTATPLPQTQAGGRGRPVGLDGIGLVLLLLAGSWQAASALNAPQARRLLRDKVAEAGSVMDGRFAAAVNGVLAHRLPADAFLRAGAGMLRWKLFASGGPQVWVGDADWLFLTDEMRAWPNGQRDLDARVDVLGRIGAELDRRGIELVVAVVPDKARTAAGVLGAVPYSADAAARLDALLPKIRSRCVRVADLAAAFRAVPDPARLYYRTDTHWNQDGAALAARTLAAALRTRFDAPPVAYRTEAADAVADRPGDLLRLMSLDGVPAGWPIRLHPRPDREAAERTQAAGAAATGSTFGPGGGLLDDGPAGPEAVLLGTSFSLNANFAGRLQEALEAPVASFAQLGGGFAGAAAEYFASPAFQETPPRMVLWEVSERAFSRPWDEADTTLAGIAARWAGARDPVALPEPSPAP